MIYIYICPHCKCEINFEIEIAKNTITDIQEEPSECPECGLSINRELLEGNIHDYVEDYIRYSKDE